MLISMLVDTAFHRSLTQIRRNRAHGPLAMAVARPKTVALDGLDLRGTELTGLEVDRARETVGLIPLITTADVKPALNPALSTRIVLQGRFSKRNVFGMESFQCLLLHRPLADPNRLVRGKPLAFPLFVAGVPSTMSLSLEIGAIVTTPGEGEGVSLGSALGILNANHYHSAVLRPANQFLTAPPIHPPKAEVRRAVRHYTRAFEPAPLRRSPRQISERRTPPANLHFGRPIGYNFDRTHTPFGGCRRL